VVTTRRFDHPTSNAILRMANRGDWRLVIVDVSTSSSTSNTTTLEDYLSSSKRVHSTTLLQDKESVHFFSVQQQNKWRDLAGPIGALARQATTAKTTSTPSSHCMSRKNLGYLYAIRHGAKFIFDLDSNLVQTNGDDDENNEIVLPNKQEMENVSFVILGKNIFNPYPLLLLGASSTTTSSTTTTTSSSLNETLPTIWPRGFPLKHIPNVYTHGKVLFSKTIPMSKIGVVQFIVDGNLDLDTIHHHHHSHKLPPLSSTSTGSTSSTRTSFQQLQSSLLIVPPHAHAPYNAHATLHTFKAFWALLLPTTVPDLLLPTTVPERVSDIWRSYFAQCLFRVLQVLPARIDDHLPAMHNTLLLLLLLLRQRIILLILMI
jgi:hypothetical protein